MAADRLEEIKARFKTKPWMRAPDDMRYLLSELDHARTVLAEMLEQHRDACSACDWSEAFLANTPRPTPKRGQPVRFPLVDDEGQPLE